MTNNIPEELYQAIVENIPIVSADVVVLDENKFLLLRRTIEPLKGYWALPGGRLLLGETPRTAACRRLKDEAKIFTWPWELVGERVVNYFHPGRQNVAITYLCYYDGSIVVPKGGHDSHQWFSRDDLPTPIWNTTIEQIDWALQKGEQLSKAIHQGGTN